MSFFDLLSNFGDIVDESTPGRQRRPTPPSDSTVRLHRPTPPLLVWNRSSGLWLPNPKLQAPKPTAAGTESVGFVQQRAEMWRPVCSDVDANVDFE